MQTDAQANAKAVWPCVRCLDWGSSVATLTSVLRVWQSMRGIANCDTARFSKPPSCSYWCDIIRIEPRLLLDGQDPVPIVKDRCALPLGSDGANTYWGAASSQFYHPFLPKKPKRSRRIAEQFAGRGVLHGKQD